MKKILTFAFLLGVAGFGVVGFGTAVHAQSVGSGYPTVPTGLTATIEPPSQISLSWQPSTESSGTIQDYYVYRNGIHLTTTAGTTLIDSGLLPGLYIYEVAAVDANNNVSAESSSTSVSLLTDTTPPSMPTGVTVTGTTSTNSLYSSTTLTISWGASTDNVGVAGYYVYRNGQELVVSTSSPITGTSITDNVTPGTYTYTVAAYDASQNISNRSAGATVTVGIDSIPPSIPTNISGAQTSANGVTLSWSPSIDPPTGTGPGSGVAGYQVYRNGIQIASTSGTAYNDTGLTTELSYIYTVAAYDEVGNVSVRSAPVTVFVQQENGPSIPNGLTAYLEGTSTIKLSWDSAEDVVPLTGYTLYRNDVAAANVASTTLTYLDQGLASGTYVYNVEAVDVNDDISATSSPASVVVPATFVGLPITATPPAIVSSTPAISANAGSSATSSVVGPGISEPASTMPSTITQFLYFGLRDGQVQALQSLLVAQGYLSPVSATGYFGSITLAAVEKFQCDQSIVCTGGPGWGTVGPKTRNALNALAANGSAPSMTASVSSSSSVAGLNAELALLEAELASLEKEAQSSNP